METPGARPTPSLFSGIYDKFKFFLALTPWLEIFLPLTITFPLYSLSILDIMLASSTCPLPETPAIPKTSPDWTVRDMFSKVGTFEWVFSKKIFLKLIKFQKE